MDNGKKLGCSESSTLPQLKAEMLEDLERVNCGSVMVLIPWQNFFENL